MIMRGGNAPFRAPPLLPLPPWSPLAAEQIVIVDCNPRTASAFSFAMSLPTEHQVISEWSVVTIELLEEVAQVEALLFCECFHPFSRLLPSNERRRLLLHSFSEFLPSFVAQTEELSAAFCFLYYYEFACCT